jgi:hypothetical protein
MAHRIPESGKCDVIVERDGKSEGGEGYLGGTFFRIGSDLHGSFLDVLLGGMFLLDLAHSMETSLLCRHLSAQFARNAASRQTVRRYLPSTKRIVREFSYTMFPTSCVS